MYGAIQQHLSRQLDEIRNAGLFKGERVLSTAQQAHVGVKTRSDVLNMCANNYLGLANHPEVVQAAREALDHWGNGLASVRFICGTQQPHKELERSLSQFLGTEDTILYSSCWDANGGLFETILGAEDAVISDELNHASIIDGIRLCKSKRLRYKNNDMADLEAKLQEARDARFRLIATDGVFSMDGIIADLESICNLAEKYDALVMVDDSHAVAARMNTEASWAVSTSSPARSAKPSGARAAGIRAPGPKSSPSCGSGLVLIFSRTRSRLRSWAPHSRPSSFAPARPSCGTGWRRTPSFSARP
jgi:glycine C-acetyltransferase